MSDRNCLADPCVKRWEFFAGIVGFSAGGAVLFIATCFVWGFCFSFLAVLEHRDATSYVLQPSFGFFPSRPARDPTPNAKHEITSRPVFPLLNFAEAPYKVRPLTSIFSCIDSLGTRTARRTLRDGGQLYGTAVTVLVGD